MVIYFDTETTGLYPGRIIQLAYVIDDGQTQRGKNFYFAVDYIEPSAVNVHGITVEKLKVLSGGHTFSEYADEIYDDFASADLIVAHNVKFDLGFMNAEFSYLDRVFKYSEALDSMKYFTPIMKLKRMSHSTYKYPKLAELVEFAEVFPYDVSRATRHIFDGAYMDFHDAVFDTTALYLAVTALKDKYPELKELLDGAAKGQEDEG